MVKPNTFMLICPMGICGQSLRRSFRAGLRAANSKFRYCFSDACSLQSKLLSQTSWKGVAVVASVPTRPIPAQIPEMVVDSGSCMLFTSLIRDAWVTGAVIYGEPDGHHYPNHAMNNECMLHHVASHICHLSSGLRFISGDWNAEFDSLPVFDLLAQAGFREIQDLALGCWGQPVQTTCKGRTRKDFMFLSPELQSLLQGVEVTHDVWPDHAVLKASFHSPNQLPPQWRWQVPAAFPWPKQFAQNVQWTPQDSDATSAYAALCSHIEHSACEVIPFPVAKRMLGRAQTLKPALHKVGSFAPVKTARTGEFQHKFFGTSVRYAQWVRQVRRLQHFHRMVAANTVRQSGQLAEVWGSIVRAKGFPPSFPTWWAESTFKSALAPARCPAFPPDPVTAQAMYESMMMATRDFEKQLKKQSRHYARFRREQNPNLIFQDIKPPAVPGVDILLQPIRAKVADVDDMDCKIVLDNECPFSAEVPISCRGQPLQVIHHDTDCLWLESVDGISPGDVVSQIKPVGSLDALAKEFTQVWRARWMRHADVPAAGGTPLLPLLVTNCPQDALIGKALTLNPCTSVLGPRSQKLQEVLMGSHAKIFLECRNLFCKLSATFSKLLKLRVFGHSNWLKVKWLA